MDTHLFADIPCGGLLFLSSMENPARAVPPRWYKETRGPYDYYVMSAQRSAPTDRVPPVIQEGEGRHVVDWLTLEPAEDMSEAWLTEHGYLAEGGRVSWSRFQTLFDLTQQFESTLVWCQRAKQASMLGCGRSST